jgi:proteasome assembly chaperone (PAC2) family protein
MTLGGLSSELLAKELVVMAACCSGCRLDRAVAQLQSTGVGLRNSAEGEGVVGSRSPGVPGLIARGGIIS